jgi:hypothetical protein
MFGDLIRQQLQAGEIPFRKASMQAIIDRVEVHDDLIKICRRKDGAGTRCAY